MRQKPPKILILLLINIEICSSCHSLSSQYNQFSSRRARARAATSLERTSENAIDFDYLTSNLPYSANEIRALSSLTPFPTKPQLTISEGGKLTCNFDDSMEYCGWHNAENIEMKFWKGRLDDQRRFDSQRFDSSSALSFSTDNNFLLAGGEPMMASQTAAIEMEIPCQYGDADVEFDFWTNTLTVLVRYCISKIDSEFSNCQMIYRTTNPLNFSIPTTADGLKIRIEVLNIDGDSVVLIDNLHYNGQICELVDEAVEQSFVSFESSTSAVDVESLVPFGSSSAPTIITGSPEPLPDPTVQKFFEEDLEATTTNTQSALGITSITPAQSQINVMELSPCSALTCSFNDGDSCFYGLSGVGGTSAWNLGDRLIGNRHTGIQRINLDDQVKVGFAYVGSDSKSEAGNIFVMESPKFSLRREVFMIFDIYIRSVSPKLKICIDNFENCPYSSPRLRKNQFWQGEQKVTLKEGSRKVFFVAQNVKKHQFLAIDNIRLENFDGSSMC